MSRIVRAEVEAEGPESASFPSSILRLSKYLVASRTRTAPDPSAIGLSTVTTFQARARPRMWGGSGTVNSRNSLSLGGVSAGCIGGTASSRGIAVGCSCSSALSIGNHCATSCSCGIISETSRRASENAPPSHDTTANNNTSSSSKRRIPSARYEANTDATSASAVGSGTGEQSMDSNQAPRKKPKLQEDATTTTTRTVTTIKTNRTKKTTKKKFDSKSSYRPRYCCHRPTTITNADGTVSRLTVTFTPKLVTKTWTRPATKPSDVAKLFYSKDDQNRFKQEKRRMQRRIARGMIDDDDDVDERDDEDDDDDDDDDDDCSSDDSSDEEEEEDEGEFGGPTFEEVLRDNVAFAAEDDDVVAEEELSAQVRNPITKAFASTPTLASPPSPTTTVATAHLVRAACRSLVSETADGDSAGSRGSRDGSSPRGTTDSEKSPLLVASC